MLLVEQALGENRAMRRDERRCGAADAKGALSGWPRAAPTALFGAASEKISRTAGPSASARVSAAAGQQRAFVGLGDRSEALRRS